MALRTRRLRRNSQLGGVQQQRRGGRWRLGSHGVKGGDWGEIEKMDGSDGNCRIKEN